MYTQNKKLIYSLYLCKFQDVKLVITIKLACTNAVKTASCPDDVTALQDNVTEDVNRAGTPKLVSKVCVSILQQCHILASLALMRSKRSFYTDNPWTFRNKISEFLSTYERNMFQQNFNYVHYDSFLVNHFGIAHHQISKSYNQLYLLTIERHLSINFLAFIFFKNFIDSLYIEYLNLHTKWKTTPT